jgi:poly(A) polymerase
MTPERLQPLLDETQPLAAAFAAAGHRLYLVGGIVRDLLLGHALDHPDLDFTTDARPEQTKAILHGVARSVWTQGERFGTIGASVGGRPVEITTHRAEHYEPDSRKPFVAFGDTIEDDLARRDFTINAMALELTTAEPRLIDPFDGALDIVAKRLRTPLAAEVSFSEDPLRMMRAARFIARYDMQPDPELVLATEQLAERLDIVSVERIREELDKLMVVPDPSAGLWYLVDHGLAQRFLPELPQLRVEQDPIHRHKDVLTHTIAVIANTSPTLVVRLAALFHDVGKPRTRAVGDGGVSFHHHEVVGARMTRERMKALRYSKQMVSDVTQLVYLHLRFHTYQMGWSDAAVRRFVRDAGDLLDELIELTRCDCTTRNRRKAEMLSRRMDELEARIAEVRAAEELSAIRPDVDGTEVMEHLGLAPGREVGQAMRFLLELRLERGPLERDEVLAELDRWWAERQG